MILAPTDRPLPGFGGYVSTFRQPLTIDRFPSVMTAGRLRSATFVTFCIHCPSGNTQSSITLIENENSSQFWLIDAGTICTSNNGEILQL
jgi:hypothetical protein